MDISFFSCDSDPPGGAESCQIRRDARERCMHRAPRSKFRIQNPHSKIRAPPPAARNRARLDEMGGALHASRADQTPEAESKIQNPKSRRPPWRRGRGFVGSSRDPRCAEVRPSPSQLRRPQEICSARDQIFCSKIILPEIDKKSKIQNPRPAALVRAGVLLRFQIPHSAASAAWGAEQNYTKS